MKGAGWVITPSTVMRRGAVTDRRQCFLCRLRSYTSDAPSGVPLSALGTLLPRSRSTPAATRFPSCRRRRRWSPDWCSPRRRRLWLAVAEPGVTAARMGLGGRPALVRRSAALRSSGSWPSRAWSCRDR